MAYATYITSAIVVGSRGGRGADRSFQLYTEGAGMLYATARSVREERSRQRYALQDFSIIRISLVRGKSDWRIGSVEGEYNAYFEATSREARGAVVAIVRALRMYVRGESPDPRIFADTRRALIRAASLTDPVEVAGLVERYLLRLLYHLGYIADQQSFEDVVVSDVWDQDCLPLTIDAHRAIKQAREVSHL